MEKKSGWLVVGFGLPLIVSACFCESANGGAVARFGFGLCI